jgi:hypothetical protein
MHATDRFARCSTAGDGSREPELTAYSGGTAGFETFFAECIAQRIARCGLRK